ncbi:TetR family transcriptional regulator [Streptacidiphilus cavernicola]|uniref:TetR family transcriptional regulator n=1 Tax=Streptacidiphilus cavernicola TaxID=3342716 RepID=A0ABV6VV00_9ACTN
MSNGIDDLLAAPLGLRERKKLKTRRAIRAAAFRLFTEQGYDATTVDQISAEADVSPSTFFRYFPTKEDLVISDDYDPLMEAALRDRPLDEPLLTAIRAAILPALRMVMGSEHDDMLLRMRLLQDNPLVRARNVAEQQRTKEMLLRILAERAERADRPLDELRLRVQVAAVLAASTEAIEYWAKRGGQDNIAELVGQALDTLSTDAVG